MLIVLNFNPLRSFYIRGLDTTTRGPNPAREAIHPVYKAILQTTIHGPNPAREYILYKQWKINWQQPFHLVECNTSQNNRNT